MSTLLQHIQPMKTERFEIAIDPILVWKNKRHGNPQSLYHWSVYHDHHFLKCNKNASVDKVHFHSNMPF